MPVAGRQPSWVRFGEHGGHHRGRRAGQASTGVARERGRATCLLVTEPGVGDRVTKGPGVVLGAPPRSRAREGDHKPREHARYRDASDKCRVPRWAGGQSSRRIVPTKVGHQGPRDPREGRRPPGRASAGRRQGRDFELTNPDNSTPVDRGRAAAALREEPDASIAHVRVCGGAGWVTTGSTRQPTANSLRSCVARLLGAAHRGR